MNNGTDYFKIAESMLREQFKTENGIEWKNEQGEPDIEYVNWLERKIANIAKPRRYTRNICEVDFGQ